MHQPSLGIGWRRRLIMFSTYISRWRHALSAALLLTMVVSTGLYAVGASGVAHARTASEATVTTHTRVVQPGTFVTVTASGFLPGESVQLALSPTNAAGAALGFSTMLTPTANSSGSLRVVLAIPINTPLGPYVLRAAGLSSQRIAYQRITVIIPKPVLSVSPPDFGPYAVIRVTGRGFFPHELITLTLNNPTSAVSVPLRQATADEFGNFASTVHVPAGPAPGTQQIVAIGQTSQREGSIAVVFAIQPASVAVTPGTATPSTVVILTAAHFQPGELVVVTLATSTHTYAMRAVHADSRGGLGAYRLTIPADASGGMATIIVSGQSSHASATTQVMITAAAPPSGLSLSNTSVMPGAILTVQGSGFTPGEAVGIVLRGPVVTFALATTIASASGTISIPNVQVPTVVGAGAYWISASGQTSGRTLSAQLNVM
jgi:hypothetical protein